MSESQWHKKGATLSHKNACKEFGLTEDEIIEAISPNIRHRLWLQHAVNSLSGLGQEEDVTLAHEEEEGWRIEELIEALKECKESIEYFDLTLEGLFEFVELPPQDEKILVEYMRQELGLIFVKEKLNSVL